MIKLQKLLQQTSRELYDQSYKKQNLPVNLFDHQIPGRPSTIKFPEKRFSPHHGNSFLSFGAEPPVGGWVELARTTLGGTSTTVTATSIANKRYFMVLENLFGTAAVRPRRRSGNGSLDTGNNYSSRNSSGGASDATQVSQPSIPFNSTTQSTPYFHVSYLANLSAQEKILLGHSVNQNTLGAGTPPTREEAIGKHAFTSNPLDQIASLTTVSTFAAASEIVILGWDEADIHTTNFWGQEGSAIGSTLDITYATARKYMWAQFLVKAGGAGTTLGLRLGNGSLDSGSAYAFRQSEDDAVDSTFTSQNEIQLNQVTLAANELLYVNIFVINNAVNEKIMIIHTVDTNAGVGATNPPSRDEIVAKHVNTSNQDNHIGIVAIAGSISATSSRGKGWGGD